MKSIRISVAALLVAFSLAGQGVAQAQHTPEGNQVNVVKSDKKKFRLHTPQMPVDVALIDADGTVLYQGTVNRKDARATSFNLATLPDGQYFLTATAPDFWMSQALTVRNNDLTVDAQTMQQVNKPTLTAYEKNKFEMTIPGVNVPATTSIAIYNAANELVFSDQLVGATGKRFNLTRLPEGEYTFVVNPGQASFSERIAIRR
jgi:hypothetical protein